MSPTEPDDNTIPEGDDFIAAEYVLGVLPAAGASGGCAPYRNGQAFCAARCALADSNSTLSTMSTTRRKPRNI